MNAVEANKLVAQFLNAPKAGQTVMAISEFKSWPLSIGEWADCFEKFEHQGFEVTAVLTHSRFFAPIIRKDWVDWGDSEEPWTFKLWNAQILLDDTLAIYEAWFFGRKRESESESEGPTLLWHVFGTV